MDFILTDVICFAFMVALPLPAMVAAPFFKWLALTRRLKTGEKVGVELTVYSIIGTLIMLSLSSEGVPLYLSMIPFIVSWWLDGANLFVRNWREIEHLLEG